MTATTFRAAYAQYLLEKQLIGVYNISHDEDVKKLPKPDASHWSALFDASVEPDYNQAICIIGAGPAGLAAALFLRYIGFQNITIREASSRVGGRCYSYTFQNGPNCPHNYYDAGAMRLPKIDTQKRLDLEIQSVCELISVHSTFNMISWLNDNNQKVPLKPYVYDSGSEPSWYEYTPNNEFDTYMRGLLIEQGFPVTEAGAGPVLPDPLIPSKKSEMVNGQNRQDFVSAFWNFIGNADMKPDQYSTRNWLMTSPQ